MALELRAIWWVLFPTHGMTGKGSSQPRRNPGDPLGAGIRWALAEPHTEKSADQFAFYSRKWDMDVGAEHLHADQRKCIT